MSRAAQDPQDPGRAAQSVSRRRQAGNRMYLTCKNDLHCFKRRANVARDPAREIREDKPRKKRTRIAASKHAVAGNFDAIDHLRGCRNALRNRSAAHYVLTSSRPSRYCPALGSARHYTRNDAASEKAPCLGVCERAASVSGVLAAHHGRRCNALHRLDNQPLRPRRIFVVPQHAVASWWQADVRSIRTPREGERSAASHLSLFTSTA